MKSRPRDFCLNKAIRSPHTELIWITLIIINRGGVPEDVLGLEDTFWSPWPWPRSLKSSKIALSSVRGQHYFWTVEILLENARNLAKNLHRPFFWFPQVEIAWKKIFKDFFAWKKLLKAYFFLRSPEENFWRPFFFLENTCVCVLSPCLREGLSLASKFFCVLGLGPCVLDSTSDNQGV